MSKDDRGKATLEDRFISWLGSLSEAEHSKAKATLAVLRRGLGKTPGSHMEMYQFMGGFLAAVAHDEWKFKTYCMVAALFASHPLPGGEGNLGSTLALVKRNTESESIDKRFLALLNCHRDDLFNHLRHTVSLAKANNAPVNWRGLLSDVLYWSHYEKTVQKRWAKAYWKNEITVEAGPENNSDSEEDVVNES